MSKIKQLIAIRETERNEQLDALYKEDNSVELLNNKLKQ
jgi:hypothetical protein